MFPLIPIRSMIGPQMCHKLQAVWTLSVCRESRWETDHSWQWKSCCSKLLGNVGFTPQQPIREGDFEKMWPHYYPFYLIWSALPLWSKQLSLYLEVEENWTEKMFRIMYDPSRNMRWWSFWRTQECSTLTTLCALQDANKSVLPQNFKTHDKNLLSLVYSNNILYVKTKVNRANIISYISI